MKFLLSFIICFALIHTAIAEKRALTFEDLFLMKRISDPRVSPDGTKMVFTVRIFNINTNKNQKDLYIFDFNSKQVIPLTETEYSEFNPRWSADSKKIAFLSKQHGKSEIFWMPLIDPKPVLAATIPVEVNEFEWSAHGNGFIFTADIYSEAKSLYESSDISKKAEQNPVKAYSTDKLFFRSWNSWRNNMNTHIFLYTFEDKRIKDLTPGEIDSPPLDLTGDIDYCISKDGKSFYFTANKTDMPAANTNNDIFKFDFETGKEINITEPNAGNDNNPMLSPNQNYLVYKQMARAGFEADQYNLILVDNKKGTISNLTEKLDLSVNHVVWAPNNKGLYFTAAHHARHHLYYIDLSGKLTLLENRYYLGDITITPDNKHLIAERRAVNLPTEIFSFNIKKRQWAQLTFINKNRLDEIEMPDVDEYWTKTNVKDSVHVLLLKPPFFDENKKYPLVVIIHGGPQGATSDNFHYRWNLSMFAAKGYVVIAPNFHGSRGYGQKFCDAVSKNWGGDPYDDVLSATREAIKRYSFIDGGRVAAAGASYGGFMVDWIEGHNPDNLFTCLISHAGVFDQRSMYGATEELWFPEWEFGGTPYENPALFEKHSPSYYVTGFNTPCLVICGELDYRVPYTQSLQMFTALQRNNVPSRLIVFPDEDHFVTKPQNAKYWWENVYNWLDTYLK